MSELKGFRITLAAARVNAGLSQEEAARRLSVNRATVANWENGTTVPSWEKVKLIQDVYDIPADNLIFGSNGSLKMK